MAILETDRLLLREFKDSDLDALHALFGDEKVMKYTGGSKTMDETKKALTSMITTAGSVIGLWPVIHKADNTLIGRAGFVRYGEKQLIEVVYLLAEPYWGQGLATELLQALLLYGFSKLGFEEIIAFGELENPATLRVMEKAGMVFDKETIYYEKSAKMYVANSKNFV